MRFILDRPIHQVFYNTPDDDGGAAFQISTSDVPGDEPPDFSFLESKVNKEPEQEPAQSAQDHQESTSEAGDGQTPQEGETEEERAARARDEKGRFKKQEKEEPFPEIEEGKKPEAKEPEKQEKQPEAEKKEPEAKKPDELPPDDTDIDKLQPRPNMADKDVASFKTMRDLLKQERTARRELAEKLKATGDGLTPETKAELERLRNVEKMVLAETHPDFQKEVDGKVTESEDSLFKLLTEHPRLKLKAESAEALRKMGLDTEDGREALNNILAAVEKTGNKLLYHEVLDSIRNRDAAARDREKKVAEVRQNADKWFQERQQVTVQERQNWGKTADEHLKKIVMEGENNEWVLLRDVPENATAEQKAAIEAHNTRVQKEIAPKFHAAIKSLYDRDPKVSMETVFKAIAYDEQVASIKSKDAEIAKLNERITELTKAAQGVRRISAPAKIENSAHDATRKEVHTPRGDKEESVDEALENFLASKNQG